MAREVLDTSFLIRKWWICWKRTRVPKTPRIAESWAQELIAENRTDVILTPVYIEFVAGITNKEYMLLARHYLAQFKIADDGRTMPEDWQEARRLAERVPRNGRPRQLVDCLIRAIANRLNRDVFTLDTGFPK